MADRPLISYQPNAALDWLYHRFFEHIEVDERWAQAVRDADARGTVVYVLRNLSFIDFLALDHLTKRLRLPEVRFANDLGLWLLEPMGRGWLQALTPRTGEEDAADLRRAIRQGSSAVLFLKRPPTLLDPPGGGRGKSQGDDFIKTLFDVQREMDRPILLVPQVFVWSKQKDAAERTLLDAVLGPREWPGKIRTIAQFLANYRHVTLRAGEPVDVRSFLAQEQHGDAPPTPDDDVLVRRMTYLLLRRLERERRSVVGPSKKASDRLRDEVIRSPKLQKTIRDMAGDGVTERRILTLRALSMVREMEADLDMSTIAALDATVDRVLPRMFSALEIDEEGIARVRAAMTQGTVIFLPSHKSHIDYVVLAYVLYTHHVQLPIIAAGDNLNFFPLGGIFRRGGAFFIRRSFRGDRLYGAVVDAYMRRLLFDGWSLEFFLEGGRSRTGKLLPPKLGLLSVVIDAALGVTSRPTYFVPVSIGYERVVEEASYVKELSGGEKRREDVRGLLSTARLVGGRYGRVNVQFGELFTLDAIRRDVGAEGEARLTPSKRRAIVTRLAFGVMNEINQVTAVTAGAVVATALLTHDKRGMTRDDLVAACRRVTDILRSFGARFSAPLVRAAGTGSHEPSHDANDAEFADAVREACELFVRAGHVTVQLPGRHVATKNQVSVLHQNPEAIVSVPDEHRLSLDLSKNIVLHFFVSRALVATALGPARTEHSQQASPMETLSARVASLSRLFKYEFQFRADAPFETIFEETVRGMADDSEIAIARVPAAIVRAKDTGKLAFYAAVVKNFIEAYRVAARALTLLLKGPLSEKELLKRALTVGQRMFLAGEIERREAVSRPVLENAFTSFVDQGYLERNDGAKLSLSESYASNETVRTIEAKVAAYLG